MDVLFIPLGLVVDCILEPFLLPLVLSLDLTLNHPLHLATIIN
jgi:hypothetical protein